VKSKRRLPENREMEYQLRLQRDNFRNISSGHSPRDDYRKAAADSTWNWAKANLPYNEFERIARRWVDELSVVIDREELHSNTAEFRAAWEEVGDRRVQYEQDNNGAPAPRLMVQAWVAEVLDPIGHLEIGVPDKKLDMRWARPIRSVAKSEITRLGEIRTINLTRVGHGRKQIQEAENCLTFVNASESMTLGQAFNF
jgi:hypothetical protein